MIYRFFVRITSIALLGLVLSACSQTKLLDSKGSAEVPELTPTETVSTYDQEFIGSSSEIYGEEDTLDEQSPKLVEAAKEDPLLIYNIIYFDYDSTVLSREALEIIRRHSEYLLNHDDVSFILEGHTDNRGSAGYNIALGERRADAVKRALLEYGVGQGKLQIISHGEERPAVEDDTEEAFSKNRRAEIIYK